jgi:hypothetical protein
MWTLQGDAVPLTLPIQGDAVPLTPAKGRYTPFGIPVQIHQNPLKGILLNLVRESRMTAMAWDKGDRFS